MLRFLILALLALMNLQTAEAGPRHVLGKVAKAAIIWGAPVATSLLATKGGVDCRNRNGVEPCTSHYGSFNGTEATRGAISLSLGAMTFGCLKETGWKGCYTFAAGVSAFNLYWWRHEEGIHAKPEMGLARSSFAFRK